MEYIKPVVLDLEEKFLESVKVIQGDTARSILFSILSDGKPFDLTGKTVRVYAIKPDGEDVYNELEITNATEGLAKLKLTSQILAVPGKLKLILVISQGTDILSSNAIFFTIDPTIKDDNALESTSEYSAFTTALATAQSVETSFGDMLDRLDTIVDADLIEQVVTQYIQDNSVEITGDSVVSIVNTAIQNGEIVVNAEVSDSEISQAIGNYLSENPVSSVETVNNLTTTETGKALDATQGKILKDSLDKFKETVNGSSTPTINAESKLIGKTILAIGDSYIKGHTLSDNQTWLYKLANRNNMTKYNYGVNGICLAKASTQTNGSIMDNINNIISSVASTDYVVVLAGHNDSNASLNGGTAIPIGSNSDSVNTTFKGALNNLITLLLNAYPRAKILFLTPFNRINTEEDYVEAMKEICSKYGIPCFDNFHAGGMCWQNDSQKSVYDLNDSLHFNEEGQERLSYLYENILNNELALNPSTSSNSAAVDTSNLVTKTQVPYSLKVISKTDYDNLETKNSNTIYFVEGYGVYVGINCIISTDNQQGTGEESGGGTGETFSLNTFVLGTLSPDDTASLIDNNTNRATSLKNELVSGDVIGFTSDLTSTYKFSVDKSFDSKLEWIGGGYQTSYRYTITEDGTYNIMIARQDNKEITSSELSELNNIFKKFSKLL